MSLDANGGEPASGTLAIPEIVLETDTSRMTASDAARLLAEHRYKRDNKEAAAPEAEAAAADEPQPELADEADAAPEEQAPGETEETTDPALPPVDPPRSLSKEDKELFKNLPRDLQESFAERLRSVDKDVSKRQNEAAERIKAVEAKERQAEEVRQKFETALPSLLQNLQDQLAGEFSDIKTGADVTRMASDDPNRYLRWDAHQKNIALVQQQVSEATSRQQQEQQQKWSTFAADQDKLFAEKAPEMADRAKATKLADAAIGVLKELGFSDDDLAKNWLGQDKVSLRDHRLQLLVRDAVKFREAQQAVKKTPAKPIPPVQKPGVAGTQSASLTTLQTLKEAFEKNPTPRTAADYEVARREARSRRVS